MLDFALGMANTCRSYSTVAMKRAVTWLFLPTTGESSIVTSRGLVGTRPEHVRGYN